MEILAWKLFNYLVTHCLTGCSWAEIVQELNLTKEELDMCIALSRRKAAE